MLHYIFNKINPHAHHKREEHRVLLVAFSLIIRLLKKDLALIVKLIYNYGDCAIKVFS